MSSNVSPLLRGTRVPAIAALGPRIAEARRRHPDLIDLGQAVPHYGPPARALAALGDRLRAPELHRYTQDEGLLTLRERWAEVLGARLRLRVDPRRELFITAGANQAYLMAAMTLLGPGDGMGLLSPWYFNHAMAVEMVGGRLVEIALSADTGFALDVDRVVDVARRERLKAVTLVTPSNPTGVVYPPAALAELTERLGAMGVYLIADETYAFFAPPESPHYSAGSATASPEWVITLGSFSKTFGLTGWRVGYLVAAEPILGEMLKVQDTMIVCASHPGQALVELCLEDAGAWIDARAGEMSRRTAAVHRVASALGRWRVASAGPFFAYLVGPGDAPTADRVLDALLARGVVALPGDSFGSGLERTLRLSLGGVDEARLDEGLARVAAVLRG